MPIEILRDSSVSDDDQIALVNKYTKLRTSGDIAGILDIVTDDIHMESTFATAKGKTAFEAYLKKQKAGEGKPAEMVDGICQMQGTAKVAFISVSFVAKFGIVDTDKGPLIEKIAIGRS